MTMCSYIEHVDSLYQFAGAIIIGRGLAFVPDDKMLTGSKMSTQAGLKALLKLRTDARVGLTFFIIGLAIIGLDPTFDQKFYMFLVWLVMILGYIGLRRESVQQDLTALKAA